MLRRAVVRHAIRELVESVEEERDPPLFEHVLKRLEIVPRNIYPPEMRSEQFRKRMLLFELAHLQQHRPNRVVLPDHPPTELPEQKCLARPEFTEHEQKSPLRRR